jgi:hypothetical protein
LKCEHCGKELPLYEKECPNCGKIVDSSNYNGIFFEEKIIKVLESSKSIMDKRMKSFGWVLRDESFDKILIKGKSKTIYIQHYVREISNANYQNWIKKEREFNTYQGVLEKQKEKSENKNKFIKIIVSSILSLLVVILFIIIGLQTDYLWLFILLGFVIGFQVYVFGVNRGLDFRDLYHDSGFLFSIFIKLIAFILTLEISPIMFVISIIKGPYVNVKFYE